MADHQRIHPVQDSHVAALTEPPQKPTTSLVGRGSYRSENGDPERQYPPPVFHRTIPYTPTKPPRRKTSCCIKCFCCTLSLMLLLIIILGILAAVIYFVFQPKIPKFSINSMRITQFNLGNDNSLSATFNVNITSKNPNTKIGIYYENGSYMSVWYVGTRLCEGSLPEFYQGPRTTTMLSLMLAGQTQDAEGLLQALQVQQQSGTIPLNLRATVPVRLNVGGLKSMKWKFLVRCSLVVDSLTEDNAVRIRNSRCRFGFKL